MSDENYEFEELPLNGIRAGTSVLVAGSVHAGTRALGFQMQGGLDDEGVIIVTTNRRAARIAEDCTDYGIKISPDSTAILDCVGEEDSSVPARVLTVAGPRDLTGIGMRFSDVYREFNKGGIDRVRTGLVSVSTLLSFGDLRTISRFVHTLVGRIDSVDGLGVFLIDPTNHDERTVSTLAQFCNGRINVRETDGTPDLQVRGLPDQSREWMSMQGTTTQ